MSHVLDAIEQMYRVIGDVDGGWQRQTSEWQDAALRARNTYAAGGPALDVAEQLFGVLANVSGGDWNLQSKAWQEQAYRARNAYHAALDAEQARPDVDIPGHRILDVLRSDYQMLYRLAADRLKSLDAAATAVPTAPEWPGSRYVGTVRGDDPGPRQAPEQDVIRKTGVTDLLEQKLSARLGEVQQLKAEVRVLECQLADSERVAAKLARETDQLRADLQAADGVIIESSETVLTLQRRVAAAERDLTAIRQVLNPEQWATADVRQGPERLDRKV